MSEFRLCPLCGGQLELRPIGDRQRHQCLRCEWIHWDPPVPVVVVLAATSSGKVLYTRHAGWPRGHWGLISGYVEQGETLEEAALREVREESSLEPRDPKVIRSSPWRNELLVCVTVEIDEGKPRLGGEADLEAVELAEADAARIPDSYPAHQFLAAWITDRALRA